MHDYWLFKFKQQRLISVSSLLKVVSDKGDVHNWAVLCILVESPFKRCGSWKTLGERYVAWIYQCSVLPFAANISSGRHIPKAYLGKYKNMYSMDSFDKWAQKTREVKVPKRAESRRTGSWAETLECECCVIAMRERQGVQVIASRARIGFSNYMKKRLVHGANYKTSVAACFQYFWYWS